MLVDGMEPEEMDDATFAKLSAFRGSFDRCSPPDVSLPTSTGN